MRFSSAFDVCTVDSSGNSYRQY